jgi:hypothetical protein
MDGRLRKFLEFKRHPPYRGWLSDGLRGYHIDPVTHLRLVSCYKGVRPGDLVREAKEAQKGGKEIAR